MRKLNDWRGAALVVLCLAATAATNPVAADDEPKPKTTTLQIYRVEAAQAAEALQDFLNNAKQNVAIDVDSVNNKLALTIPTENFNEAMKMVTEFVAKIDVPPVMHHIDVLVAEVKSRDGREGLRLFGDGRNLATMTTEKFAGLFTELQKQGRVDVISAPKIETFDNQPARILIGQSWPYVTGASATPDANYIAVTTNTIAYRHVGIQVQVTPMVSSDGKVLMFIKPEITTVLPTTNQFADGVFATAIHTQTLETTMSVKDGETAVGRLIELDDAGMPGHRSGKKQITELLVFVTPHVVNQQR
jgi:general secretion pathway protein D